MECEVSNRLTVFVLCIYTLPHSTFIYAATHTNTKLLHLDNTSNIGFYAASAMPTYFKGSAHVVLSVTTKGSHSIPLLNLLHRIYSYVQQGHYLVLTATLTSF